MQLQLLSAEDRARAEAFADAEVERINPRCRAAYRHTVLQRVAAEIIDDNERQRAFQALVVDQAVAKIEAIGMLRHTVVTDEEQWVSDPAERKAARERGLLLAKLEAERGVDASW